MLEEKVHLELATLFHTFVRYSHALYNYTYTLATKKPRLLHVFTQKRYLPHCGLYTHLTSFTIP